MHNDSSMLSKLLTHDQLINHIEHIHCQEHFLDNV